MKAKFFAIALCVSLLVLAVPVLADIDSMYTERDMSLWDYWNEFYVMLLEISRDLSITFANVTVTDTIEAYRGVFTEFTTVNTTSMNITGDQDISGYNNVSGRSVLASPVWVGDSADGTYRTSTPAPILGEYIDMSSSGTSRIVLQGGLPLSSIIETDSALNEKHFMHGVSAGDYGWFIVNDDSISLKSTPMTMDMTDGSVNWSAPANFEAVSSFEQDTTFDVRAISDIYASKDDPSNSLISFGSGEWSITANSVTLADFDGTGTPRTNFYENVIVASGKDLQVNDIWDSGGSTANIDLSTVGEMHFEIFGSNLFECLLFGSICQIGDSGNPMALISWGDYRVNSDTNRFESGASQDRADGFDGSYGYIDSTTANSGFNLTDWTEYTFDGSVTVDTRSDNKAAQFVVDAPSNRVSHFTIKHDNKLNWILRGEATSEGSNLQLRRFNTNTGAYIDSPLYVFNDTGDVNITNDLNVLKNITGNQIYGEMWNRTNSDDPFIIPIDSIGVYYNMTNLTDGNVNGFTFTTTDQPFGGSYLTALVPGRYRVTASFSSIVGTASGDLYGYAISHNFERDGHNNCYARRTAVNNVGNVGVTCFMDVEVGDTINIQIEQETGAVARDIAFHTVNMNVVRIGD